MLAGCVVCWPVGATEATVAMEAMEAMEATVAGLCGPSLTLKSSGYI